MNEFIMRLLSLGIGSLFAILLAYAIMNGKNGPLGTSLLVGLTVFFIGAAFVPKHSRK